MAEEETPKEEPQERTIPYTRFKEVNDKLADERKARSDLETRIAQLEDADKPHLERLTKDLERAAKRAEEAENRASELESARQRDQKAAWLSSAAAKQNFHDPDVAARMVDLEQIEDATSAAKAIKALAKDNEWLVKQEQKAPSLQKVGIAGAEQEPAAEGLSQADIERQWGLQVLKGLDPSAVE